MAVLALFSATVMFQPFTEWNICTKDRKSCTLRESQSCACSLVDFLIVSSRSLFTTRISQYHVIPWSGRRWLHQLAWGFVPNKTPDHTTDI